MRAGGGLTRTGPAGTEVPTGPEQKQLDEGAVFSNSPNLWSIYGPAVLVCGGGTSF